MDGVRVGFSPHTVELEVGEHTASVSLSRHEPASRTVAVDAAETTAVRIALEKQKGGLYIATSPAGAQVYLDDRALGASAQSIEAVEPGEYAVTARLVGYTVAEQTATVESGADTRLDIPLKLKRDWTFSPQIQYLNVRQCLLLTPCKEAFSIENCY